MDAHQQHHHHPQQHHAELSAAAVVEVDQDTGCPEQPAAPAPPAPQPPRLEALRLRAASPERAARPGGGAGAAPARQQPHHASASDEDDWQMVTPGGSPRSPGGRSLSHSSLGAGEQPSECSETGAQAELHSLALADSILGCPAAGAGTDTAASSALLPCTPTAARPAPGDGAAAEAPAGDAEAPERAEGPEAAPAGPAASADGDEAGAVAPCELYSCPALDALVSALAAGGGGAAAALRGAGAVVEGQVVALSRWLVESMAAVAQGARGGGSAVHDALRAALLRLAAALPRTSKAGGGVDGIDWRTVGLAGGLVVSAAAAVCAFYTAWRLKDELGRRDRELAKLVVRIMSLQELLNSQRRSGAASGVGPGAGAARFAPAAAQRRFTATTTTTTTTLTHGAAPHAVAAGLARGLAFL